VTISKAIVWCPGAISVDDDDGGDNDAFAPAAAADTETRRISPTPPTDRPPPSSSCPVNYLFRRCQERNTRSLCLSLRQVLTPLP